ncbi:MAG TPA: hypothetical protein VMR49_00895 [Candidatus Paceibacterota bacterium]|jgi:heme/copper-type cytochrome/quinol oxidase subunit 4|nr:hypothetical protein [Candidatus Paceibacterota bacterium]
MEQENNKNINVESIKRQSSSWEVGMPFLQILLIIFSVLVMMGQWDSSSNKAIEIIKIIHIIVIVSPIFSLYLFLKTRQKGKRYDLIAFIISFIVPIILCYILIFNP